MPEPHPPLPPPGIISIITNIITITLIVTNNNTNNNNNNNNNTDQSTPTTTTIAGTPTQIPFFVSPLRHEPSSLALEPLPTSHPRGHFHASLVSEPAFFLSDRAESPVT